MSEPDRPTRRSPNYGRPSPYSRGEPIFVLDVDTEAWRAIVGTGDGRRAIIEGGSHTRLVQRVALLKAGVWCLPENARMEERA